MCSSLENLGIESIVRYRLLLISLLLFEPIRHTQTTGAGSFLKKSPWLFDSSNSIYTPKLILRMRNQVLSKPFIYALSGLKNILSYMEK